MGGACSCTVVMSTHTWTPPKHSAHIFSCLFPCLGGYCGLCVWVCLCLLSCKILSMPPLPRTYHCTLQTLCFWVFNNMPSTTAAQLKTINCHCISSPQWRGFILSIDCVNNNAGRRVSLSCSAKYRWYPSSCVQYEIEYTKSTTLCNQKVENVCI